jgi:hypothetical protein
MGVLFRITHYSITPLLHHSSLLDRFVTHRDTAKDVLIPLG